jgi:hypothetical protein
MGLLTAEYRLDRSFCAMVVYMYIYNKCRVVAYRSIIS